jgi:AAA+ superfamily predicted ATPase
MDVAFRRIFQRFVHVTLPDSKSQSQMMQNWYKGFNHTITKAEFDYMANRLHGMGPTDIHKFMDHALASRKTELYDSESHKLVANYDGQKYVAHANDVRRAAKHS